MEEIAIIRLWDKTNPQKEGVRTKDIIFCYTIQQFVEELERVRNRKDYDSFSVYMARLIMEDTKFC